MFVCLEIDTEDAEIWTEIDAALVQKFGCVHIIWGVIPGEGNKAVACNLPGNVFYVATTQKESEFAQSIKSAIRQIWSGGYRLLCTNTNWSQLESPYKKPRDVVSSAQPVDLEVDREE